MLGLVVVLWADGAWLASARSWPSSQKSLSLTFTGGLVCNINVGRGGKRRGGGGDEMQIDSYVLSWLHARGARRVLCNLCETVSWVMGRCSPSQRKLNPFSADKWTNALLFSSVSMPLLSFIKMGEKMSRCEWKQLTSQGAFDSLLILLPHKTRKRENQTTLVTMPATLGLPPLHKKGAGFQWRMEYNNLQVVTPIDANCWMQKAGVFICSHDCIGFGLLTARKGDFIERLR